MSFVQVINFKMPTIVGILKFITRTNDMLMLVEHDFFYTFGPGIFIELKIIG